MADETPEQQAIKNFWNSVGIFIGQGQEDFGNETFDGLCQDVASTIGREAITPLMESIYHTDAPARVIEYLAANPDKAKKIATMHPGRRAAELGRIEAQIMPNGLGGDIGADPAWITRARGGEKRGLGDDLDDKTWERNFKKKFPNGFNPRNR